jgi:hypothetical protein
MKLLIYIITCFFLQSLYADSLFSSKQLASDIAGEIANSFIDELKNNTSLYKYEKIKIETDGFWTCPESIQEKFAGRYTTPEISHYFKLAYSNYGKDYKGKFTIKNYNQRWIIHEVKLENHLLNEYKNSCGFQFQGNKHTTSESAIDYWIQLN